MPTIQNKTKVKLKQEIINAVMQSIPTIKYRFI